MPSTPLIVKIGLVYIAFSSILVGAWAQFAPEQFYANFPISGHAWVALDGAFNEHLIRDVGGLNLALASLALIALLRPSLIQAPVVGIAALVFGVPHLIYHLAHLGIYQPSDQIGNALALSLNVAMPILLFLKQPERTQTK
jgi:hypothetical protein